MPSLTKFGSQRRQSLRTALSGRTQRSIQLYLPRAQGPNGSEVTPAPFKLTPSMAFQQSPGIYYGSNPPQDVQHGGTLSPYPQQQMPPQYYPPPHGNSLYSPQSSQPPPQLPPSQQSAYSVPQNRGSTGKTVSRLPRINPGRNTINTVRLMGTISQPQSQSRCTCAIIQVPFATKGGMQEFLVEAWYTEADHLLGLDGTQVVLDGRLRVDTSNREVKIVASRIQVVDGSLPPTPFTNSYRNGAPGSEPRAPGEGRAAAVPMDPQALWRLHYSTQTKSFKALAAHFGLTTDTVSRALLQHAHRSKSPLHWRVLAEEAGLGLEENGLHLSDFLALVAQYKEEVALMHQQAQPGATPPPLPTSNDGMLKVKPIREWALAKPQDDLAHYTVTQYESKHGLSMLYGVLRMGVVAEATQGAWNYDVEFGPGPT